MGLVGSAVEVAGHEDGKLRAVLLPVELQEAQDLADLAQADDAEVRLVREQEMCVDHHDFGAAVVAVAHCRTEQLSA